MTSAPQLASMLQIMLWVISSRPARPKSASGLRSAMPHGPSATNSAGSHPDRANDGASSVYAQTANPAARPAIAPARVACFQ